MENGSSGSYFCSGSTNSSTQSGASSGRTIWRPNLAPSSRLKNSTSPLSSSLTDVTVTSSPSMVNVIPTTKFSMAISASPSSCFRAASSKSISCAWFSACLASPPTLSVCPSAAWRMASHITSTSGAEILLSPKRACAIWSGASPFPLFLV